MKRIFGIILVLLVFLGHGRAQTKVGRFCIVDVHRRNGFTTKIVAHLQTWQRPEYFSFKDSSVIADLYKVDSLETAPDVLNYMSSMGWKLVSEINGHYGELLFTFKREFDPAELANN